MQRILLLASACMASVAFAGCGMPGAPLPPSLNLPAPVRNLTATRTGDQVALAWTMPTRTTDKVVLKGTITVRVCRSENRGSTCAAATTLQLSPGTDGRFTDALPTTLAAGSPRALTYAIELVNRKGRSAGLSNAAEVLAGAAPPQVDGLNAALRRDGVLLSWAPMSAASYPAAIRLQRRLLMPPAKRSEQKPQGVLAPPPEPVERTLLVDAGLSGDRVLDRDIRFGQTYEYRAQRLVSATINGQTLELASPLSAPVHISAEDIFPPAVPRGLAAVATAGENGNSPAIDLSWLPDSDADLAGYAVYRKQITAAETTATGWERISPAQPLPGPGFHDSNVQPGRTYAYSVTAVGQNGHESARSPQTQETVPGP